MLAPLAVHRSGVAGRCGELLGKASKKRGPGGSEGELELALVLLLVELDQAREVGDATVVPVVSLSELIVSALETTVGRARHRPMWAASLSLALLCSCDTGIKPRKEPVETASTSTAVPTASGAPREATCELQVEALKHWMKKLKAEGRSFGVPFLKRNSSLLRVDKKANGKVSAYTLDIDEPYIKLDSSPVFGSIKDLERGAPMRELVDAWNKKSRPAHSFDIPLDTINLLIEPTVRWQALTNLQDVLIGMGIDSIVLPFRANSELEEPTGPVAARSKRFAKPTDPTQRSPVLQKSDQVEGPKLFDDCPQVPQRVNQALSAHGSASPDQLIEILMEQTPPGLLACSCQANFEDVKASLWSRMDRFGSVPVWSARLRLAPSKSPPDASTTMIALPADTPWRKAYQAVLSARDASGRHRFAIAP